MLVLPEAVGRDGIPALCDAVRSALERTGDGARVVVCDTDALGAPDLAQVDLLARLELTARRPAAASGCAPPPPRYARSSPPSDSASRRRGSPKRGNQREVSRKQWKPVIRPADSSSTCTAQGLNPPLSGSGL